LRPCLKPKEESGLVNNHRISRAADFRSSGPAGPWCDQVGRAAELVVQRRNGRPVAGWTATFGALGTYRTTREPSQKGQQE